MIDLGISKLLLIGIVALVVVGPEKLPGLARNLGTWVGRMQRHINRMKEEMGGLQELQELRDMKRTMEQAAWDAQHQMQSMASKFERDVGLASRAYSDVEDVHDVGSASPQAHNSRASYRTTANAVQPRKNWRAQRSALPQWYKARHSLRTRVLSNAAQLARQRQRND